MVKSKKRPLSDGDYEASSSSEKKQPCNNNNNNSNNRTKQELDDSSASFLNESGSTSNEDDSLLDSTLTSTTTTAASKNDESGNSSSMNQNVRVVARLRPLSNKERNEQSQEAIKAHPESSTIMLDKNRTYEYDAVFDPAFTQREVYERTAGDTVKSNIFKGFNVTILAYGQTGSGKTFTMGTSGGGGGGGDEKIVNPEQQDEKKLLDEEEKQASLSPPAEGDGIIPRAVYDLFQTRNQMKRGRERVKVEMSYLEIYNEEARDLLCSNDPSNQNTLYIRDSKTDGVYVQNLSWKEVTSPDQVTEMMESAAGRRATASTQMNAVSSRSHAICTLHVTIAPLTDVDDDDDDEEDGDEEIRAKLTLVDLAGSERIKRTGAEGSRLKEGININKGLFVLGQVVSSLSELGQQGQDTGSSNHLHVPYRDSKLTRLLQDSLGGNSRTIMVACISPADSNVEESINTMRYAQRARNIKNSAVRNTVAAAMSPVEAAALRRENQMLKLQILQLQSKVEINPATSLTSTAQSSVGVMSSSGCDGTEGKCNNIDVSKLETVTKFRARCAWQESRIEQLENECRSAAEDALTASLKADRAQVKLEELMAMAKNQNITLPSHFVPNGDTGGIVQELRNEVLDLKSQLHDARSDAAVSQAMAAAVVAGDGNLSTVEEMALISEDAEGNSHDAEHSTDNGKLAAELVAVSGGIEQKEAMADRLNKERELQQAMRSHFEGALNSLQEEVDALTAERQEILGKVSQKQKPASSEPDEKMRARIKELESRIKELKDKATEHKKSLRRADQAEKRCTQLAAEIQADKKRRATLQKKLKEESEERRSEKRTAQLHAARMLRDSQKLKYELQKVKDAAARQATVLRRKAAEAVRRQKKSAEQQRKRKLATSMRSQLGTNNVAREDLVAWLDREIEFSFEKLQTKEQIEDQKAQLEDAMDKRNELDADGSLDSTSARALDSEIEMRKSVIKQLDSNANEFQQAFTANFGNNVADSHHFQETTIWNSLSRSDLKALFPIAFESLATLKCELAKIQNGQAEVIAKVCGKAVAEEKRRAEEQVMALKLENLEAMATLLETTKSAVEHEVRSAVAPKTGSIESPFKQSAVDEMLKTYLDGSNKIGAKVKEDLADIRSRQDGMTQLMTNVANGIIAKNEETASSSNNKKKSKQKAIKPEGYSEEVYEVLDLEEVENEAIDASDDSDWSPDTPARKKLKKTPVEAGRQKIQGSPSPNSPLSDENKTGGDTTHVEKEEETDLSSLKVTELRAMLRQLGLPVSGKKNELIVRLRASKILTGMRASAPNHDQDMHHPPASFTEVAQNEEHHALESTKQAKKTIFEPKEIQETHPTLSIKKGRQNRIEDDVDKENQENQPPKSAKKARRRGGDEKLDHDNPFCSGADKVSNGNQLKRTPLKPRPDFASNIQMHTTHTAASAAKQKPSGRSSTKRNPKVKLGEGRRRRKSMRMAVNQTLLDLEKLQATL